MSTLASVLLGILAYFFLAPDTQQASVPAAPSAPLRDALIYSTRGDERVHLLALPDLQPIAIYEAGAGAHELAISADGRWALGSAYGGPGANHQPADKRIFVLDLPSGKASRMIDLGSSQRPNDIAFLRQSSVAIVTTEVPAQLLRVDAQTGAFEAQPLANKANHMLAHSPDTQTCFVSHAFPGGVTRVDLATKKELLHAKLPAGAEGIACVGEGDALRLWVGCNRASKLLVLRADTLEVEHEFERGGFPLRVKAAPNGAWVAVSCPLSGEVVLFNAKDPKQSETIALAEQMEAKVAPTSIAFSPDSKQLLVVANGEQDWIVAIDVVTRKVSAKVLAAGKIADALAAGRVQVPR